MKINFKALNNSYINHHLVGKGISIQDIEKCLENGIEVTDEVKNPKKGSRYFKLEIPDGAGLPGRFVLPELDSPLGGKIANWNSPCEFKFRHGKLAPVIRRDQLPEWLIQFASVLYVILEKNQLPDGRLQTPDGPTEEDPEGSWLVATAHFGPPSRLKPRIPKDCSDPKVLRQYLEDLDNWSREQDRVLFVDLEIDGQTGLSEKSLHESDENFELKKLIAYQGKMIEEMQKQMESLRKQLQNRNKKNSET